ncbi:hypothetical protein ACLOJK_007251 [Asimina triloba]
MKRYNVRDRFHSPQIREGEPGWNAASPIDLDSSTVEDAPTARIRTAMPRRRQPTKRPPQLILATAIGSSSPADTEDFPAQVKSSSPTAAQAGPPLSATAIEPSSPAANIRSTTSVTASI